MIYSLGCLTYLDTYGYGEESRLHHMVQEIEEVTPPVVTPSAQEQPVVTPPTQEQQVTPLNMKSLLEAGVHFGHQRRRWNPKMRRYIFSHRNGIHIIHL